MQILITGATGFIGQALIKHLRYDKLTVLTRNPQKAKTIFQYDQSSKIDYITSLNELTDLNHIDLVINLAGEPIADKPWTKTQKNLICQSRYSITQNLVELIQNSDHPPATFISASAIGYYGNQPNIIIDESSQLAYSGFTHQVCQKWEQLAMQASSKKTRVCLLRLATVLGAKGGALAKLVPLFKWGLGGKIASGNQYFSWIHILDVVSAVHYLSSKYKASGIFNLSAPHAVTNEVFTKHLGKVLHRPTLLTIPKFVISMKMGESSCLLLDDIHVKPKHLLDIGFEFSFAYIEDALEQIFKDN